MHESAVTISCRISRLSTEISMSASIRADTANTANKMIEPITLTLNAVFIIERKRNEKQSVLSMDSGVFLCTIVAASFGCDALLKIR